MSEFQERIDNFRVKYFRVENTRLGIKSLINDHGCADNCDQNHKGMCPDKLAEIIASIGGIPTHLCELSWGYSSSGPDDEGDEFDYQIIEFGTSMQNAIDIAFLAYVRYVIDGDKTVVKIAEHYGIYNKILSGEIW